MFPNANYGSQWPELSPMCSKRQTQSHKGLSMSSRSSQGDSCPQPRENCHSSPSLFSFLSPVEEGLCATWGARILALAESKRKSLRFSDHVCTGVDGGRTWDWQGRHKSVWAALTAQLTSVEVCRCQGHVPTVHLAAIPLRRGRQWWEPKDLLKASSYCKLAQRSLQSKKSLWFCIWHT